MPKKKNFLGGQQNYNPNNGQYEPALKGPNGESPSQFSSFKKAESKDKNESFDAINKKRMYGEKQFSNQNSEERLQEGGLKGSFERAGFKVSEVTDKSMVIDDRFKVVENENAGFDIYDGEQKIAEDIGNQKDFVDFIKKYKEENGSSEEPKGSTQYFKHPEVDGVWHDTGKTIEKGGNSYKVYENEQGETWAVSDRFAKQFQPFDKDKKTELLSKDYLDKFYELSGGDENKMLDLIRKDPAYMNNDADPNDTWSMGDLEGVVGAYFEKRNSQNKDNSFEEINAKRMGKEQPKSEETTNDDYKYSEYDKNVKVKNSVYDAFMENGGFEDNDDGTPNEENINDFITSGNYSKEDIDELYNYLTEYNNHSTAKMLKENYEKYKNGGGLSTSQSNLFNDFNKAEDKDKWQLDRIEEYVGGNIHPKRKQELSKYFNAQGIPLDKIDEYRNNKDLNKESVARKLFDKYFGREEENKKFDAEIKKTADEIRKSGDRYTYMMLDRLRSDAEYVTGEYGGKGAMNQLWYNGDPKKHIALMRELHRGLKEKPQWLPYDKIAEYEKKLKELK